ncbi:MAG: DUF2804 domain-containing protein [Candidatus Binatia bacterium]
MQRLIDATGQVRCGIFAEPVGEVNYRDYTLTTPFGAPAGRWARRFGFNQFQFLGALSESLVFGCAIADIKYAGTVFVYLFEPASGRLVEHSFQTPLGRGIQFDQDPENGRASFRSRRGTVEMGSSAAPAQRTLRVALADGTAIDARFDEQSPPQQPMRICTRAGASGWVYARKTAGMPVSGSVTWEGRRFDLAALGTRGHCDWSAGYMRRETFWNWGCLAGAAADGRTLGMNVSCGVNETGFTESCFWVDGALHKVDVVAFDYDRTDLMRPWHLYSADGRVDLTFQPQARHVENVNAWIIATNFNQLLGRYRGRLRTAAGETIAVDGLLGYAESHYAKW